MVNIIKKINLKLTLTTKFLFEQKMGWRKPSAGETIPKYILKKYLPPNPVMIDCGAHDGVDSVELIRILGGSIHCFEPVPEIFSRLKNYASSYKNMHCYELALGDRNGKQVFYISKGNSDASSSLLEPKEHLLDHPGTHFEDKIEVNVVLLDEWARQNKIEKVDLLWLDMQGFELNMLQASEHILNTVSAIHTEVSTKETYKGVASYGEYRAFLEGKGFSVVHEAIPQGWDMGNVLFVRKGR